MEMTIDLTLSPACECTVLQNAVDAIYLGGWEIERGNLSVGKQIGEGEFGIVHKGMYNGNPCAIKMLKENIDQRSLQHQRLMIEITILALVKPHPSVVGFIGGCIHDLSSPVIVEELIDGVNLQDHLAGQNEDFRLRRAQVVCKQNVAFRVCLRRDAWCL